jgi:preprotein translocase subunit YajC
MHLPDAEIGGAVLAIGGPAQPGGNLLVQLLPFAMILAIFYYIILMPMKRRQRKVAQFQAALKVGDRVVMTSGIHGVITKVDDRAVQLQIADKVRIEVARAAIGGYQGQEPVVSDSGNV